MISKAGLELPGCFVRDSQTDISVEEIMNSQGKSTAIPTPAALYLTAILGFFPVNATEAAGELIMSAAPRENTIQSQDIYEPLAQYLSRVTGKTVVYRDPGNWLTYQLEMRNNVYDLTFDSPAFIGWRMENLGHVPLVKLPGKLSIVAFARANNSKVKTLKDLAGRRLCGFAPPNFATLTVQFEFDNPVRQPQLVEIKGFRAAYDMVAEGKCDGGVLQAKLYEDYDRQAHLMKVLFKSTPVPNQGFSAGPRIDATMRARIVEALMSEEGRRATSAIRDTFKGQEFEPAKAQEYEGLGVYLSSTWGFNAPPASAKRR
jgi:ABC-type phosphate/phosphonate transport system substrate-binding protein